MGPIAPDRTREMTSEHAAVTTLNGHLVSGHATIRRPSLLLTTLRCLSFDSEGACSLERNRANPSREAHAGLAGGPLQLFGLTCGRKHPDERLATICVIEDLRPAWPSLFWLSWHGLIIAIIRLPSRSLRHSVFMAMFIPWQQRRQYLMSDDDVLDVDGVRRLLHVGRNTVYELVGRNAIPHRRLGKTIRFSRTAVLAWLASWAIGVAKEGK